MKVQLTNRQIIGIIDLLEGSNMESANDVCAADGIIKKCQEKIMVALSESMELEAGDRLALYRILDKIQESTRSPEHERLALEVGLETKSHSLELDQKQVDLIRSTVGKVKKFSSFRKNINDVAEITGKV